jgi:imidazolonepropionase-like amidohydrolase
VNPDSAVIPVTRSSGVLLALSAPGGGTITGRSALLQLDGWTYEDLTLKADVAMHLFWPGTLPAQPTIDPRTNPWPPSPEEIRAEMQALRQFFDQARAYESACQATSEGQNYDARLEAMRPVVRGELPLMIRADTIAQIESAVAFAAEQGTRLIILGGYDAPLCAPMLDEHDVSVIVSSVYRLPMRRHEPFDHAYTLPARLLQAGVPFCISGTDRSETWNTRLLPCHAAMAAAHGLPRDEALKAITLYPAEILGVADRVGSLEVGKDATLIVTDGDPLETTTQTVLAFIQGRNIALSNKQTRLYDKYRQKYEQLQHSQPRRPNP